MTGRRICIIGLGTAEAGDDAVGLRAAALLRKSLPPDIEVLTDTAGGARVLERCKGADLLILLDAAEAGPDVPPGSVCRFSYPADRSVLRTRPARSTHALSVVDWLDLAQPLGALPSQVWVWAVAGETFKPCTPLSRAVERGMRKLAALVRAAVTGHRSSGPSLVV